jgi:hypothetical protein
MKRIFLVGCLLLAGCGGVPTSYLEADQEKYDAITPDYLSLLNQAVKSGLLKSDGKPFTADDVAKAKNTVGMWQLRIKTARGN